MRLTLFKEKGFWTAHVSQDWKPTKISKIIEDKYRLLSVVKAIQEVYPGEKIWLDKNMSPNPWVYISIQNFQFFGETPIYEDIDHMLLKNEVRNCTLCKGKAWYNSSVKCFQCTECRAQERMMNLGSLNETRFYKVGRWAK